MPKSWIIAGSETPTIVPSSTIMAKDPASTTSVSHLLSGFLVTIPRLRLKLSKRIHRMGDCR